MKTDEFEESMKAILEKVDTEATSHVFDKGYLMGKIIAQSLKPMTQAQKLEFQDGLDSGMYVELLDKGEIQ